MTPLELLYFLGLSIKKRYVLRYQKRLPQKVISIGNITLGGTGKTPAAIALAREAQRTGFKPCILTRGYKGKAEGPCFVSRGKGPLLDENQAGDEAILMAEKLNSVPIVKGKNRYEAGMFAIQNLKSQISDLKSEILFILDDGFQHWALFRDKDILLIDSTNPFGNRRLLPFGSLREPIGAIKRADIIVITNTNMQHSAISNQRSGDTSSLTLLPRGGGMGVGGWRQEAGVKRLLEEIRQYNLKAPIFFAEHRPSTFITMKGETFPLEWAKNKKVFGFCGIGNPHSFKKTLLSTEIDVKGLITFRDHYRYSQDDIRKLIIQTKKSGAEWIVTTEKDIMKLKGLDIIENVVALTIEFTIDEGFYEEVLETFISK